MASPITRTGQPANVLTTWSRLAFTGALPRVPRPGRLLLAEYSRRPRPDRRHGHRAGGAAPTATPSRARCRAAAPGTRRGARLRYRRGYRRPARTRPD